MELFPDTFEYFGVKPERIWKVISRDLPELKQSMRFVCRELEQREV